MTDIEHLTVDEWLQDWAQRRDAGHHLRGHDDVVNRTLGFRDLTDQSHVFITKVNAMTSGRKVRETTYSRINKTEARDWHRRDPRAILLHNEPAEE